MTWFDIVKRQLLEQKPVEIDMADDESCCNAAKLEFLRITEEAGKTWFSPSKEEGFDEGSFSSWADNITQEIESVSCDDLLGWIMDFQNSVTEMGKSSLKQGNWSQRDNNAMLTWLYGLRDLIREYERCTDSIKKSDDYWDKVRKVSLYGPGADFDIRDNWHEFLSLMFENDKRALKKKGNYIMNELRRTVRSGHKDWDMLKYLDFWMKNFIIAPEKFLPTDIPPLEVRKNFLNVPKWNHMGYLAHEWDINSDEGWAVTQHEKYGFRLYYRWKETGLIFEYKIDGLMGYAKLNEIAKKLNINSAYILPTNYARITQIVAPISSDSSHVSFPIRDPDSPPAAA